MMSKSPFFCFFSCFIFPTFWGLITVILFLACEHSFIDIRGVFLEGVFPPPPSEWSLCILKPAFTLIRFGLEALCPVFSCISSLLSLHNLQHFVHNPFAAEWPNAFSLGLVWSY